MEEWRDIKGYEGKYQVSSFGRVRSTDRLFSCLTNRWGAKIPTTRKGRILKPFKVGSGYLMVSLGRGNKKYIHRLVAHAFVDGYAEVLEVDHINENKQDNRAVNLRWVTKKVNNSTPNHVRKISEANAYIVMQYTKDGHFIAEYPSIIKASKITGICKTTISKHIQGHYTHAGGYIWKRK